MAWVWKVEQQIQRTTVTCLCCHGMINTWRWLHGGLGQHWGIVGHWWELCFSVAGGAYSPDLSLLTPSDSPYLQHLNTADGRGCSRTTQVTQIKSHGARKPFEIIRVLFSSQCSLPITSLLLLYFNEVQARCLSAFKVLLKETGVACVWEKERDVFAMLWTILSHPSKCALPSNCCLIVSEMLFSGLTTCEGFWEGRDSTDPTITTYNAYETHR